MHFLLYTGAGTLLLVVAASAVVAIAVWWAVALAVAIVAFAVWALARGVRRLHEGAAGAGAAPPVHDGRRRAAGDVRG